MAARVWVEGPSVQMIFVRRFVGLLIISFFAAFHLSIAGQSQEYSGAAETAQCPLKEGSLAGALVRTVSFLDFPQTQKAFNLLILRDLGL